MMNRLLSCIGISVLEKESNNWAPYQSVDRSPSGSPEPVPRSLGSPESLPRTPSMIAMVDLREFIDNEERRPEQPDSSKTVKYVAMTEKVFEKFSKTEEEHPFLKELPEIPNERVENIQLQILTTINMDDAFIFMRDHIKSMGMDSVVAVELYANALTGF